MRTLCMKERKVVAYIHYDRKKRRREERGGEDQANRATNPIIPNFCRSFFFARPPIPYVSHTPRSHAREHVTAQAHASAIRSRFHHAHYIRCLCQRAHCYVSYNDYISNGWGLWRFDQDVSLGTYRYDTPRYKRLTDGITTWADNATPSSTSTRLAITFYHY